MSKKKPHLEICPVCRAALVSHMKKGSVVLWCSRNPVHFRWEVET